MKNKSTVRPVLFSLLIIASLCAYVFVNFNDLDTSTVVEKEVAVQEEQPTEGINDNDELFLLDVELLKYVFDKTVSYIPTIDI